MSAEGRGIGLTTRVILGVVVLTALGFVFAAGVAGLVHRQILLQEVDASLAQEVAELRTFAGQAHDPRTGARIGSTEQLLFEALRHNVPDEFEDHLAIVDGQIPFVSGRESGFRAAEVEGLAAAASRIDPDGAPQMATHKAGNRAVRYVAVPVRVDGDPQQGVFVAAVDLDAETARKNGMLRAYAIASALTLVVVAFVMILLLRLLLRPLRTLASTAERITEEDLSRRIPEHGADDLARLTATVNGMLDRLERAFRDQRALLDDVGHELRTPLTVVRGHLEIMDPTDPAEVTETRDLCLDEVGRMSRLVDELVLLARSARPDFVDLRPTDIDDLVTGVLDRVRPLADRRWTVDHRSNVVTAADPARLTQAMLQLTSNAVRHTDDGAEIAVGSAVADDTVSLWVRDTGPGVPPAEQQAIFERFRRGSDSRGAGSGLGLSIVAAIAEAHGGTARCTGVQGAGATFIIEIPLDPKEATP